MEFRATISKEEISALPRVSYGGEIVVVDTRKAIESACEYLSQQSMLGFDTESRPSFRKGIVNKISLLQLSTEEKCFLFRLCRINLDKAILKILENKNIMKVGLSVSGDMRELGMLCSFRPRGFVDLQEMVPAYGINDLSLVKITGIVLSGWLSKAQRLSNWESVQLTDAQKIYAATDAWVCTEIYKTLKSIESRC